MLTRLGAKQIVHRLLSSAPFFVLALAAIFAEPSGQNNRDIFWAANAFFQSPLNALLGVVVVLGYFALWWWTSIIDEDSRKPTQKALVGFTAKLDAAQRSLRSAASEAEFAKQVSNLNGVLEELQSWMASSMSEAAWERMISPNRMAVSWSYSGQAASDPNFYNHRDSVLSLNEARIGILDEMTKCDAWDR